MGVSVSPLRCATISRMVDWIHQSIHEAIEAHRTLRRGACLRKQFEAVHGPTRVYTHADFLPKPSTRVQVAAPQLGLNRKHRRSARYTELEVAHYAQVMAAQSGVCYLCREPFHEADPATKDHVWPRARGGRNMRNILWANASCNNLKGDRAPTEAEMAILRRVYQSMDEKPLAPP
jgi:5-methylcytosine-specific restriction endonuclease McrA